MPAPKRQRTPKSKKVNKPIVDSLTTTTSLPPPLPFPLAQYNNDKSSLAVIYSHLDSSRVKIWNTANSTIMNDILIKGPELITCLIWSTVNVTQLTSPSSDNNSNATTSTPSSVNSKKRKKTKKSDKDSDSAMAIDDNNKNSSNNNNAIIESKEENEVIIVGTNHGNIHILSTASGMILKTLSAKDPISSITTTPADDHQIWIGTKTGHVLLMDMNTGNITK